MTRFPPASRRLPPRCAAVADAARAANVTVLGAKVHRTHAMQAVWRTLPTPPPLKWGHLRNVTASAVVLRANDAGKPALYCADAGHALAPGALALAARCVVAASI